MVLMIGTPGFGWFSTNNNNVWSMDEQLFGVKRVFNRFSSISYKISPVGTRTKAENVAIVIHFGAKAMNCPNAALCSLEF